MIVINRLKLGLINFLRHFSWISKDFVEKHLEENEKGWILFCKENAATDKYITYQPKLTFLKYGKERKLWSRYITKGKPLAADFNTCEVIAVTNALINLGVEPDILSFPKILSAFEKKGASLSGYFGTAPKSVVKYIRGRGLRCEDVTKRIASIKNSSKKRSYIMICQNTKSFFDGVHTMCIISKEKGFQVLNDYEGNRSYESLSEAVSSYNSGNGKLLVLYEISI